MAKPGIPSASPWKSLYAVRSLPPKTAARRATASAIGCGLKIEQLRVAAPQRQQLFVSTRLDQAALLEDQNPVGLAHRRKAVRDEDRRPTVRQLAQSREQPVLSLCVPR